MLVGHFGHRFTPERERAASELSPEMEVFFRFSAVK